MHVKILQKNLFVENVSARSNKSDNIDDFVCVKIILFYYISKKCFK